MIRKRIVHTSRVPSFRKKQKNRAEKTQFTFLESLGTSPGHGPGPGPPKTNKKLQKIKLFINRDRSSAFKDYYLSIIFIIDFNFCIFDNV